jgi:hypothetical protein
MGAAHPLSCESIDFSSVLLSDDRMRNEPGGSRTVLCLCDDVRFGELQLPSPVMLPSWLGYFYLQRRALVLKGLVVCFGHERVCYCRRWSVVFDCDTHMDASCRLIN